MKFKIVAKNEEKILEEIITVEEKNKETIAKKENLYILSLIFISAFIVLSIHWIYASTGNVTLEQLIFHLMVPIKGTNVGMIWDYIYWTFSRIFIIIAVVGIIIFFIENKSKIGKNKIKKALYLFSKVILLVSFITVLCVMNVFSFAKNQIIASSLIEKEYIDPLSVNITFPDKKQNLIYIYLESMENTFSSKENGGLYQEDKMPELTQIAKNNINFSNTEKLGGAFDLKGTHWTIAAMVSQTSGVPLKISIGGNDYGNHSTFLPGAYTLGEVLEANGYNNYLLLGSDSEFGGRKSYFESHGNYNIWDYCSAIEENRMTEEDKVWWGYSDNDLFKYAKEQLEEITKSEEPFNFTILTVDTHFTDGYFCEKCEKHFEDQYSNVIRCSSKQVSEFVSWIKDQPFYENTTIIIPGDHLTMQAEIEDLATQINYGERTVYNAFINSKAEPISTKSRQFFTMDMYPTTLAALGAQIEGNRLGLGTNLFSDEQTLIEKYGLEYSRSELEKKSSFYNRKILYKH